MTGWNASEDRKFRPQLRKEGDSDGEEEEEEEDWDILDEPGEEAAPEPAPAAASSASSASAKKRSPTEMYRWLESGISHRVPRARQNQGCEEEAQDCLCEV